MPDAPRDPLLAALEARLGLAADPLDLDRVGAGKPTPSRISRTRRKSTAPPSPTAGKYQSSKPPRLSLRWTLRTRCLTCSSSSAGSTPAVVIGDVAGVEVEPDVRVVDLVHQGEHRVGVLGRALVGLQGDRDPELARGVAEPPEVLDDGPALGRVGRLARPPRRRPRRRTSARRTGSAARSARPPRAVRMSAPPTLQPLTLTPCSAQEVAERAGRRVVGLLGDHRRLGDDQAAEVVPAEGQLEVVDARLADLLDGRPDARRRRSSW